MTIIRNNCKHLAKQIKPQNFISTKTFSTSPKMSLFSRYSQSPIEALFNHPIFGIVSPSIDASDDHALSVAAQRQQQFGNRNKWGNEFFNGPRVDLTQDSNGFILTAEVPSLKKENINLNIDEKTRKLTLSGEMKSSFSNLPTQESQSTTTTTTTKEAESNEVSTTSTTTTPRILIQERLIGSFSRSWTLPESADLTKVSAKVQDGILTVRIPQVEKKKIVPRSVTIEDGEDDD